MLDPGDPAPTITLADYRGETITLADYRGETVGDRVAVSRPLSRGTARPPRRRRSRGASAGRIRSR